MGMTNSRVAPPFQAPRGRGGIYDPQGSDWFTKVDIADRICKLSTRLAEAPAVRQHLEHWGLYYGLNDRGALILRCARCRPESCSCGPDGLGTTRPRANEYMVAAFHDPDLRQLFDQLSLAVRE